MGASPQGIPFEVLVGLDEIPLVFWTNQLEVDCWSQLYNLENPLLGKMVPLFFRTSAINFGVFVCRDDSHKYKGVMMQLHV